MKTALASASRNAPQIISRLGIEALFDGVAEVTEARRPKPAPDLFLHAAARMATVPQACLVIEDSVPGIQGAKAAGATAIGFTAGGHCEPGHDRQLQEAGADAVAANATALRELIMDWLEK